MKKWARYTLFTLIWAAVVAYLIFAMVSVRTYRKSLRVSKVNIEVVDSSATTNLVTRSMVEGWIKQSRIATVGEAVDSLRLVELESFIKGNGFVDQVKCYTNYDGELSIEISQLRPVLRILLDSFNSYITEDGFVFARPPASSRYTQVVTGNYSPLFRAGFSGNIEEIYNAQNEELEAEINRIEVKNVYPLYAERNEIRAKLKVVNSRYTNRRMGESRAECEIRVEELRQRNARERAQYMSEIYAVEAKIERERKKQRVFENKQKKLQKKHQDFINLITFVNVVDNDKFWSSEIVQIVASESTNGDLWLELVPRSGDHSIIFGHLENIEAKLDNARTFYEEVLPNVGWQKFKSINLEYDNQVVCK